MNRKIAIVTGVTGQDGSYLAEFLLKKNYTVIGLVRRSSTNTHERIQHLMERNYALESIVARTPFSFSIVETDLTDPSSISGIINRYKPDEFYNLAAQSHVATSFSQPTLTFDVNTKGVINILEAIRQHSPHTKFYQASTSEMFGSNYSWEYNENATTVPPWTPGAEEMNRSMQFKAQNENTPFSPNSPYAISKLAAHQMVDIYRKSYGLFACCGILFNHESERRGEKFVTRKITKFVAKYKIAMDTTTRIFAEDGSANLKLGNLDAYRDWGYAPDYVEAMHLMLQPEKPMDYVIATGETHNVRDFLDAAFAAIGVECVNGEHPHVIVDPEFYRPCEVEFLCGDARRARERLGWKPKTSFKELVKKMVEHDIAQLQ